MSFDDVRNMTEAGPDPLTAGLWGRYSRVLYGVAAAGALGSIAAASADLRHFAFSYLVAFCFCLTLVLGMFFWVMLHHVTDAGWSVVVRRIPEQCLAALPILAALLVPVLICIPRLYKWYGDVSGDHILEHKRPFLNVYTFVAAMAIHFGVWLLLSRIFRGRSLAQDVSGNKQLTLSMRRWSGPGLILYAITFSFAAMHLLMTLDPHWFSTIFGVYVWAGAALSSVALMTLIVLGLMTGPLKHKVGPNHLHDLGKLLFAFSVFWAYIAFSQYFLIWYTNLPEETIWFAHRWDSPGWKAVSLLVPVGMFIVPFLSLMAAAPKRKPAVLATVSVVILIFRWIEVYWLAMPALDSHHLRLSRIWMDLSALLLVGALCGLAILRALTRNCVYPCRDPRLEESLAMGHDHEEAVLSAE